MARERDAFTYPSRSDLSFIALKKEAFMFENTFRNIDDVLWKEAGCTTELDYTEQTSWMLFLKYLDDLEHERALEAELKGQTYDPIIRDEFRWSAWAAPKTENGKFDYFPPAAELLKQGRGNWNAI